MRLVKGSAVSVQPTKSSQNILTEEDIEYIHQHSNEMPIGFRERLTKWSEKIKELYVENR